MKPEEWSDIQYFKPKEFACNCGRCGSDGNEMDLDLVRSLMWIRREIDDMIIVTSGYRCLNYQNQVNQGTLGAHPLGRAADLLFKTNDYFLKLISAISNHNTRPPTALDLLKIRGIGIYPGKAFIHIDNVQHLEKVTYNNGTEKTFKRPDLCLWGS